MEFYVMNEQHIKIAEYILKNSGSWAGSRFNMKIGQESIDFSVPEPLHVYLIEDPEYKFTNLASIPGGPHYKFPSHDFTDNSFEDVWIPESHFAHGRYFGIDTQSTSLDQINDTFGIKVNYHRQRRWLVDNAPGRCALTVTCANQLSPNLQPLYHFAWFLSQQLFHPHR